MDEIRTTVDEAHALGMLVAAHSHDTESARRALEAGVDSIEHGSGVDASLWPVVTQRGIPVAPTLLINDRLADGAIPVAGEARVDSLAEAVSDLVPSLVPVLPVASGHRRRRG